jgi:NADPH-dependent 2,4-dienoyl-CoA reductase/sulfur reductase-like enzyme
LAAKDGKKVGGVILKDGQTIDAQVVVVGAGAIPNTEYLKDSGITLDRDLGITVTDKLQIPNVDDVYAIGDLARYPYHLTGDTVRIEHWNVAQNHGRLVGKNIALLETGSKTLASFETIPYFWTAQYGKSIRYAGSGYGYTDVIIQVYLAD